jgi:hypothetical protein
VDGGFEEVGAAAGGVEALDGIYGAALRRQREARLLVPCSLGKAAPVFRLSLHLTLERDLDADTK